MEKAISITLTTNDIFNNGCHKMVYTHPKNSQLCIKIPYNAEGQEDINRELLVRQQLEKKQNYQ